MPRDTWPAIDVSLGVPEHFPPLCLSRIAEARYRSPALSPAQLECLAELTGITIRPEAFIPTAGASQGLLAALLYLREGVASGARELVTFAPFYPGYAALARLMGLRHRTMPMAPLDDPGALSDAVAAHPNAIWIVNLPHNPTGRDLDPPAFVSLFAGIAEAGGWAIWDAVYRGVAADPGLIRPAPGGVVCVGSFSKLLGIAGERAGFILAPNGQEKEVARAQWQLGLSAPATGMAMAAARLDFLDADAMQDLRRYITENRSILSAALRACGARPPDGNGPFLWLDDGAAGADLPMDLAARDIVGATGAPFGAPEGAVRLNLMIARDKARALARRLAPDD